MKRFALPLLAALALAAPAFAHGYTFGDLEIVHPHAAATTPNQLSDAGYLKIRNDGDKPEYLTGISMDVATAQIHVSKIDANGIATMEPLDQVEIPPHKMVTFQRGGLHIMMMNLKSQLNEGDMVPATLTFRNAGTVKVEFMITGPAGTGQMGGMKMDGKAKSN